MRIQRLARWTGSALLFAATVARTCAQSPDVNGTVQAIVVQPDGKVLLGGSFSAINGIERRGLARLNPDDTLDLEFQASVDNLVESVRLFPDGRIAVDYPWLTILAPDGSTELPPPDRAFLNGTISDIAILPDRNIALLAGTQIYDPVENVVWPWRETGFLRLTPDGATDLRLTLEAGVRFASAMAMQHDGRLLLAGPASTTMTSHTLVRLNWDGTRDDSFASPIFSPYGAESILCQADGRIVAAGGFRTVNGVRVVGLARLNKDGTLDPSFIGAAVGGETAKVMVEQPDGHLIIGGNFRSVDGVSRYSLARLQPDGSLDESYDPGTLLSSGSVYALAALPNGDVLVGGNFTHYGETVQRNFLRLHIACEPAHNQVSFESGLVAVDEHATNATLVLQRHGDLIGEITVRYGVGGGTALVGVDYLPFTNAVSFEDGEGLARRLSVPLTAGNEVPNDNRTLRVRLIEVTGAGTSTNLGEVIIQLVDNDTGLRAAYFDEQMPYASAHPCFTNLFRMRRDPNLGLDWYRRLPVPEISPGFSAVWKGALVPEVTDLYTFHTTTDTRHWFWLNGELLTASSGYGEQQHSEPVFLEAGRPYGVEVHFDDSSGQYRALSVSWSGLQLSKQIIPQRCFRPAPESAFAGGVAPLIVSDPNPRQVNLSPEETLRLSVSASGTVPLQYQWRQNGIPIPAATNTSWTLTDLSEAHSGSYDCLVANAAGMVASQETVLQLSGAPAAGSLISTWPGHERGKTLGVDVKDGKAYLAQGTAGMEILDVGNPGNLVALGRLSGVSSVNDVRTIGTFALLATSESINDMYFGLQVVDITDPTHPQWVNALETRGAVTGIHVEGELAFLVETSAQVIEIVDVSAPDQPRWLSVYRPFSEASWISPRAVVTSGQTLYLADRDRGFEIIDIADPANPSALGLVAKDPAGDLYGPLDLDVHGGVVYLADYRAGLKAVDVGVPTNPRVVWSYDGAKPPFETRYCEAVCLTEHGLLSVSWVMGLGYAQNVLQLWDPANPQWPSLVATNGFPRRVEAVATEGDYAYLALGAWGLEVASLTSSPPLASPGRYPSLGTAYGISVNGNQAYVADGEAGLEILDVSDPAAAPIELGRFRTDDTLFAVQVLDDRAYLAAGNQGLLILDAQDPNRLEILGECDTDGRCRSVVLQGTIAYVANETAGVEAIDITDSSNPTRLGSYDTQGTAYTVQVDGGFLYVADGPSGLVVLDIADPTSIRLLASRSTGGMAYGLALSDGLAYVADAQTGLRIYDIGDPENPTKLGEYSAGEYLGVTVSQGMALLAGRSPLPKPTDRLDLLDVRNPRRPVLIGHEQCESTLYAVQVREDRVYVAAGERGISVFARRSLPPPLEPILRALGFGDQGFVMNVTLPVSGDIVVEHTDSLTSANWQLLAPVSGQGEQTVVDPQPSARGRYYRARLVE